MRLLWMLASLLILGILVDGTTADDRPLLAKRWHDALQAIGRKYKRGATPVQTTLNREKLIAELSALEPPTVRMASTVKEVRWKNGVAEIYTKSFLPAPKSPKVKPPLQMYRVGAIEVTMEQAEAAAIKPGLPIVFQAKLTFHPRRWGAVGHTERAQQMHTLNHNYLLGAALGTYTASECEVTIAGKSYASRWSE